MKVQVFYAKLFTEFACASALHEYHPMRALFLIPRNPAPKLKSSSKW